MAIVPEFVLEILAGTVDGYEPGALDLENQGRFLEVAVLVVEVIAGGGVADKGAVDGGGGSKNFAGGEVGPVAGCAQPAGLDPV